MAAADEELVERANARIGALLKGKYTLDRVLGIGGMATVYAGTHRNGKEFAIKVLHAELSLRADMRTRFLREGYLANRVNHPGAVAVLDDDVADDGGAFLVMELLHGQTVEAIWEEQRGRLPLPLVAGIGLQLLEVLSAAHARGLIHRDIKPGNLMLTHDGQLKVLDFGIARLRDMAGSSSSTQTGMVMGTPAFMAPEHAMAKTEEIDAQTDLWAAGATMFTLATGHLVHEADNTQQLLVKAATVPARSVTKLMPTMPAVLAEVIDRSLAFEKSDRWPNAAAMQTALRDATMQAFQVVPVAAVLSSMLDELGAHEKTNVLGATDTPPVPLVAPAVPLADSDEVPTKERAAARAAAHVPRAAAPSPRADGPAAPASAHGAQPETLVGTAATHQPPPAVAMITAAAVATDSQLLRSVSKPRSVRTAVVAIAVMGIAGATVMVMRSGPSTTPVTAGSSTHATAATEAPPSVVSAASPSGQVTPNASPAWTAVIAATAVPASSNPSVHLSSPPASVPMAPRVKPTAAGPSSAPALAPAPARPSCNPPYEFDENGNKRWKRACL